MSIYARSAAYYDAIYRAQGKDYAAESARVRELIETHKRSSGNALLDVACGTGGHLEHLRAWYDCQGLDIDRTMLALAGARVPGIPLHLQDMIGFKVDGRFDAIICLFSAIAYLPSVQRLDQTLVTMARHLQPGGVVLVEPWVRPQEWIDGLVAADFADEPALKVARMSISRRDGNASILNFHYMVAASDGVRTFVEPHRLMLFSDAEYRAAFTKARLNVEYDERGLSGRGLYIGTHSL